MNIKELAAQAVSVIRTYPVEIPESQRSDWYFLKLQEEVGELTQAYLKVTGRARVRGASSGELEAKLAAELADVLGFVLIIAEERGIDLETEFRKKWISMLAKSTAERAVQI